MTHLAAATGRSHGRKIVMRTAHLLAWFAAVGCQAAHTPQVIPHRTSVTSGQPPLPDPDAWRQAVPPAGTETSWSYPIPTVTTLANQVAIYVLRTPRGPVSLSLVVRRGASDGSAEKSGLCSIAAKLMAEATKSKDHYVLSELAESLGSTLSGDANRDYVRLSLDTLAEDVTQGIALLAETLTAPALRADDFLRLRQQHLDDLAAERQIPSRLASLVGLRAELGETLGAPVAGRQASVRALTVEDVRAWHRTFVRPSDTALFVVGPVEPDAVVSIAKRHLGGLSKAAAAKPSTAALESPPNTTRIYVVDRPGSVQSSVFVAQAFPKRTEPGYAARQLLDNVIGGQFTSRINQNLREQHAYTYGAHSSAIAARHFGLLTVATSVETNVTVAAVQEIIRELNDVRGPSPRRPPSSDELQRARAGVIHQLGAHLENGHRLLADLELLFVYGLPVNYWNDYLAEIRRLDAAALVNESIRLSPDRLSIVLVGDRSTIGAQLAAARLEHTVVPAEWLD